MLAMSDHNGLVFGSIPGLANRARVPVEDARIAIEAFLSVDPDSRTKDFEGRRIEEVDGGWLLLNYAKYRAIQNAETIKESKRKYITARRKREKEEKAQNVEKSVDNVEVASTQVDIGRDIKEVDRELEKKEKKRSATLGVAAAVLVDAGFDQGTAEEFIAYKKSAKAPLTSRAWLDHQAEAKKAGWTASKAAEKVMAKGWKGFEAKYVANEQGPLMNAKQQHAADWHKGIFGSAPQAPTLQPMEALNGPSDERDA